MVSSQYQLRRLGYAQEHHLYLNIRLKPNVPVLIGRDKPKPTDDPLSNVFIKSRHVSRKHCKVTLRLDNRITLVDSSTNGTFVNGTFVKGTEVNLHVNDIIALGKDSTPEEALNSEDVLFKLELAIEMIKTEKNESDEVSQSIESSVGVKSEPGQLVDNDVGQVDNNRTATISLDNELLLESLGLVKEIDQVNENCESVIMDQLDNDTDWNILPELIRIQNRMTADEEMLNNLQSPEDLLDEYISLSEYEELLQAKNIGASEIFYKNTEQLLADLSSQSPSKESNDPISRSPATLDSCKTISEKIDSIQTADELKEIFKLGFIQGYFKSLYEWRTTTVEIGVQTESMVVEKGVQTEPAESQESEKKRTNKSSEKKMSSNEQTKPSIHSQKCKEGSLSSLEVIRKRRLSTKLSHDTEISSMSSKPEGILIKRNLRVSVERIPDEVVRRQVAEKEESTVNLFEATLKIPQID